MAFLFKKKRSEAQPPGPVPLQKSHTDGMARKPSRLTRILSRKSSLPKTPAVETPDTVLPIQNTASTATTETPETQSALLEKLAVVDTSAEAPIEVVAPSTLEGEPQLARKLFDEGSKIDTPYRVGFSVDDDYSASTAPNSPPPRVGYSVDDEYSSSKESTPVHRALPKDASPSSNLETISEALPPPTPNSRDSILTEDSADDDVVAPSRGFCAPLVPGSDEGGLSPHMRLLQYLRCGTGVNRSCDGLVDPVTKQPLQVMDLFYDKNPAVETAEERPFFDANFSQQFLADLQKGISLLYLQPDAHDDWKGRSVILTLVPGETGSSEAIQPKLQWSTMPGGMHLQRLTTTVNLLQVMNVSTQVGELEDGDDDIDDRDLCFWSLTTTSGEVHIFEAASAKQKEKMVAGLSNILSRLAFHLIVGDTQASNELYTQETKLDAGELPSLPSPWQNMNRLAHALLDG